MTLTKEQRSRKTGYESYSTEALSADIGIAKECNRIDEGTSGAVDEALDRLAKIEALVKSVDLTKCAPLPWKSKLWPFCYDGDTFEKEGGDALLDSKEEAILVKSIVGHDYKEIEKEDGCHDADILAICDSVNAVSEIKKILTPHKKG